MKKHSQHLDLSALRVGSVFLVPDGQKLDMAYGLFDTDFGKIRIATHEGKVAIVEFGTEPSIHKNFSFKRDESKVATTLERKFDLLLIGTEFQQNVWKALLKIGSGEKISYSQLAASMGIPTSTRAVASAVARNKIAYFVPCHRVTPIDGSVGNYRWGSDIKRVLLEFESK